MNAGFRIHLLLPARDHGAQSICDIGATEGEIVTLTDILPQVKDKDMVAVDDKLPIAAADGSHAAVSDVGAPEQSPFDSGSAAFQYRKEIDAVVIRGHFSTTDSNDRCAQVHRDPDLIRNASGLNVPRPLDQRGNANSALPRGPLAIEQRPTIREPLAAIVIRENHDRVVREPEAFDRLQNFSDALIDGFDHRSEEHT